MKCIKDIAERKNTKLFYNQIKQDGMFGGSTEYIKICKLDILRCVLPEDSGYPCDLLMEFLKSHGLTFSKDMHEFIMDSERCSCYYVS